MGLIRKFCMAFGALLSITIIAFMFSVILFIFISNSKDHLNDTINKFKSNKFITDSIPSSKLISINNQTKVITVNGENIKKYYEEFQNKQLNKKKFVNKNKTLEAEIKKHKNIVNTINSRLNSTWIAKFNPSAIGTISFEKSTKDDIIDEMQIPLSIILETYGRITKFYSFYDKHLNVLSQQLYGNLTNQSIKSKLKQNFNAKNKWPECKKNMGTVLNQGECGSCYAMAAASVITDRICIASKAKNTQQYSAQHIIDCCEYCGGCNGTADPLLSFMFWFDVGLVNNDCKPSTVNINCGNPCKIQAYYSSKSTETCQEKICTNSSVSHAKQQAKYVYKIGNLNSEPELSYSLYERYIFLKTKLNKFENFNKTKKKQFKTLKVVDLLKLELMEFGPVVLCFSVYEGFFHYFEGIYDFFRQPNELKIYDHCVKVIGFSNYFKSNGTMGTYLIALNSWSTQWARNGTFKIDLEELEKQSRSDLYAGTPDIK